MEHEQPINAYVCQYCKGSFDKLENLNKHVQKIHTVCSSGKENRVCPLCGTLCIKIEGYRNHLRHIHGHNEEGQVVIFKSFNDFLVWKNELEKRNYCKYVMREPPKKLPSKDKIHIYRCDSSVGSMKEKRSGVAVKESCPAVITAIESAKTKGIKIEHWNSHVGHIIPVEEDELDAAIGSLGTTEIVLTSDQGADGNIFFITESNDGSLSDPFVKEVPKKSDLFQNAKAKASDNFSKPASQKFSYKKDPTKKSGSFNYSLASVACMKPSAKKKIIAPLDVVTTCSVEDIVSTTVTNSDALLPTSSIASSEIELATESISDAINDDISSKSDIFVGAKEEKTPPTPASSSKSTPITNPNTITNQTFEFINDGSLSGQVVLLNSLPGQNGNQNVLLCSDQKFISIGAGINVGTLPPKKGKGSKKSQKSNAASQIIVIPTASEKENVSSVQNVLNLSQNPIPLDNIVSDPGPSILKKAKKSVQKSPKKSVLPTKKNITFAGKNTVSSTKKAISAKQKLSLGLNPSLDVTVIEAVDLTQSASNSSVKNVKITNSAPLEVTNSAPNKSNTNINFVSSTGETSTSSSLIANNSVLSAIKNTVSPVNQNSVSSIVKNSISSAAQISVSPAVKNSVSSAAQISVSPAVKNSVSSAAQVCVSSVTQNSAPSVAQNSVPSSIKPVNPILLNSFPPGQTFMSINNNLIPIGTPTAPLLQSNFSPGFVLTSPVPPSPIARPVRPVMTYSRLASRLPATSTPLVGSSDKKTPNKQTSIGSAARLKTPPHTSVPFLLIPNSGSQIGASVPFSTSFVASSGNVTFSSSIRPIRTQPIITNSLISSSSVLPRPLTSSSSTPVFTQLTPGTQLIPTPIISGIPAPILSNGQRISRPLLQNVPLLTSQGQQVPRSILQSISFPAPLIGQPAVVPVASKAIISTTVSNAIKVQKVQLPFSKTTNSSVTLAGIGSMANSLSESTKVSSAVLSTEPISSAPAISIPPLASVGSHKPGSVIFESQGDMYMLEPVEENSQISSNTSVRNAPNKVSIAVPSANGNTKTNKSDNVRESAFEGNKNNLSSLQKEKFPENQSILDTKVDGRVKSLSPRKNTDIKNGVQIKSVVQEKRHLKDDDVEILKKVKYYQMEMKYLASQAECKRLKLELAKAQIKNKEVVKSNSDLLFGETSSKENTNEDALHIDVSSEKNNLELKTTSSADDVTENMAMDVDNASLEPDKTIKEQIQAVDNIELNNQCDADSGDSNNGSDIHTESGYSNYDDNSPVDSEDSNHSFIADLSLKENQAKKNSLHNQNENQDDESMNCDIESEELSNLETQKQACSAELQNIKTIENESNNFNSCDQTYKSDSNEELKDINKSELLNNFSETRLQKLDDELMDISEIEENFKNAIEGNQVVKHSENGDRFEVQDLDDGGICVQNNNLDDKVHLVQGSEFCQQNNLNEEEDSMDFGDQNNSSFESEKVNLSCDKTQFHETLKELEFQYGREESSDIYTMIRTSVLRSLYDDMKTLCEENKKLYVKLQNSRSRKESCDTDEFHS